LPLATNTLPLFKSPGGVVVDGSLKSYIFIAIN